VGSPEPEDAVRALYEADARLEDPSAYASGPLAEYLRLEFLAKDHLELGPASFIVQRLATVRNDGKTAEVELRADFRSTYRVIGGEWTAHSARVQGRARVEFGSDGWRVTDIPHGTPSRMRTVFSSALGTSDGDIELQATAIDQKRGVAFMWLVHNRSHTPLELSHLSFEAALLPGLHFDGALPLRRRTVVQPGSTWGATSGWSGPYRFRGGRIAVDAVDGEGGRHSARVLLVPPSNRLLRMRLARSFDLARLFEAVAAAFVVLGLLPSFRIVPYIVGVALSIAAAARAPWLVLYALAGSRGRVFNFACGLVVAELGVGTALLFSSDHSVTTLMVWLSAIGFAAQAIVRLRKHFASA